MYKVYPKKKVIIGIDEVGRGSLAGPVCSAAAVLFGGNGGQATEDLISEIENGLNSEPIFYSNTNIKNYQKH